MTHMRARMPILFKQAGVAVMAAPLLFAIAACTEVDDGTFGTTDAGSIVYTGEYNCNLAFPATHGSIILTVPKQVGPLEISVEGDGIGVDMDAETADFGFEIERTDGTSEALLQDSIHYMDFNGSTMFTADAPQWLVRDLDKVATIAFQWEGEIATRASAPDGWTEEAAMLSECIGKPLAEVTPLEK